MAKIYYYRIKDGKMTIDQVPERWREATQALLDADKATEVSEDTATAETTTAASAGTVSILDSMTVTQLKEYAATNNIDISGLTLKADILAAIKAAVGEV